MGRRLDKRLSQQLDILNEAINDSISNSNSSAPLETRQKRQEEIDRSYKDALEIIDSLKESCTYTPERK